MDRPVLEWAILPIVLVAIMLSGFPWEGMFDDSFNVPMIEEWQGPFGTFCPGLLIANFVPLVNILTFFGFVALLVVCALPGEAGPNRWGPDPKDPSQASVFE